MSKQMLKNDEWLQKCPEALQVSDLGWTSSGLLFRMDLGTVFPYVMTFLSFPHPGIDCTWTKPESCAGICSLVGLLKSLKADIFPFSLFQSLRSVGLFSCLCTRSPVTQAFLAHCRDDCSVTAATRGRPLHFSVGMLSWKLISPLGLGLRCQSLLAPLPVASQCQPPSDACDTPERALISPQWPPLHLGLANMFSRLVKWLICRKWLDDSRWLFIPPKLCPFWTATKPICMEKLICKAPMKNLVNASEL